MYRYNHYNEWFEFWNKFKKYTILKKIRDYWICISKRLLMKKYLIFILTLIFLTSCSAVKKINSFGFGKKKNDFEKYNINEYLWKSSYELLSKHTNTNSDLKEGLITTDWFTSKKNLNTRFKITIYILGPIIKNNNLEIITEKQININGEWKKSIVSDSFNKNLKQIIIRRADNLNP